MTIYHEINTIDMAHDALDAAKQALQSCYDKPSLKNTALDIYATLYEAVMDDCDYVHAVGEVRHFVNHSDDNQDACAALDRHDNNDSWIDEVSARRRAAILSNGMARYDITPSWVV